MKEFSSKKGGRDREDHGFKIGVLEDIRNQTMKRKEI